MYSLTGTGAPTGKAQSEGALLAVKEVNEAGGLTIGDTTLQSFSQFWV
jgi:ABC-type branched-subunit amino acid transport system substrate-binding protein